MHGTPVDFLSVDVANDGTPCTATYRFDPPGGSWDVTDNRVYTIVMRELEVFDTPPPTRGYARR